MNTFFFQSKADNHSPAGEVYLLITAEPLSDELLARAAAYCVRTRRTA